MTAAALYDVLIVGGGPSGQSAALTLARALQTAVVFDSGVYRNQRTSHMHTLPTWDHRSPAEFRAAARAEFLARYKTIQVHEHGLISIKKVDSGHFEAMSTDGQLWRGRKVVLATGVRDIMPDIEGYDSCWVKGIFHCLFCHGYEERGAPSAGVLAIGELSAVPPALHLGRAARQLAGAVTIYTDGSESLSTALAKEIGSHEKDRIRTDSRQISKLVKEDEGTDITIHFRDGTTMRETFLVHRPKTDLNGPFAQQLGLELLPTGDIKTTPPFHETSSQGVFAIGDCASPGKIVANAIATGAFAGAGVAAQLQVSVL